MAENISILGYNLLIRKIVVCFLLGGTTSIHHGCNLMNSAFPTMLHFVP